MDVWAPMWEGNICFWNLFFFLLDTDVIVTLCGNISCVVWFGTMPNSKSPLGYLFNSIPCTLYEKLCVESQNGWHLSWCARGALSLCIGWGRSHNAHCLQVGKCGVCFFVFFFVTLRVWSTVRSTVRVVHSSNKHCITVYRPMSTKFSAFFQNKSH